MLRSVSFFNSADEGYEGILSDSRNFATNVGIDFKTPDEYFLEEAPHPFSREFEPSSYLSALSSIATNASKLQKSMHSPSL